jgi:dehydrogenase/reductase SDR family protein 7B
MQYYQDKIVLLTGASSGLGQSILKLLSNKPGCCIVACSRNEDDLKRRINESNRVASIDVVHLDLESTDEEIDAAMLQCYKKFDGIDTVINCAGMGFRGKIDETTLETDRRLMQVDYFGQVAVIKGVIRLWNKHAVRRGDIIQVSSVQGFLGLGERAPYSAAKHAMGGFIDSLRVEMDSYPGPSDRKVIHVCPGHIATNHSINAIVGNGSKYNQADSTTSEGYNPDFVAEELLKRASVGEREIIIAPAKVRLLLKVRSVAPLLCFRLLRNTWLGKRENFVISIVKWFLAIE